MRSGMIDIMVPAVGLRARKHERTCDDIRAALFARVWQSLIDGVDRPLRGTVCTAGQHAIIAGRAAKERVR